MVVVNKTAANGDRLPHLTQPSRKSQARIRRAGAAGEAGVTVEESTAAATVGRSRAGRWEFASMAAGIGFAAEARNRHSGLDPESRVPRSWAGAGFNWSSVESTKAKDSGFPLNRLRE